MKNITITLSENELEYIEGAVRFVADRKLGFLKNHPEGEGCEWYKHMTHTAKVLDNLSDMLVGQIAKANMPYHILTHDQKMEMQSGEVDDGELEDSAQNLYGEPTVID